MKLVFAILFFSPLIWADADQISLKNANFEYCVEKGEKIKKSNKNNLFNFMEDCIQYAGANFKAQQNPKVCFKAAELGLNNSDIHLLKQKCKDEVGYQLCVADANDFASRAKCMTNTRSPVPYADCANEVKALSGLLKKEKSVKLTAPQSAIFKKGFCEKPSFAMPPSPDEGAPGQQR